MRPFKFYNYLAQHQEFESGVKKGWQIQGRGMQGVWENLKKVKQEIQQLNQKEFRGVSERVTRMRKEPEEK